MLNNKRFIAIIPARGGSKGVPRKNLRLVHGTSLLAHAIATAKQSQFIDRVIVSSEDDEIIAQSKLSGADVPFIRPVMLAQDSTSGVQPIIHALTELPHYDYVVVLQVTSFLRQVNDIDGCLQFIMEKNAPACVSVTETNAHPCWMFEMDNQYKIKNVLPQDIPACRQDLAKTYILNGALYVAKSSWFLENKTFISPDTIAYEMPKERSLDIDTEFDFHLLDAYINYAKKKAAYEQS